MSPSVGSLVPLNVAHLQSQRMGGASGREELGLLGAGRWPSQEPGPCV